MTKPVHTKTFKSGNSVAVRLPKGFGIPEGVDLELDQKGDVVTLRVVRDADHERAAMLQMLDDLKRLPKPTSVEKRDPIIFPDRPGL
ncbi:AbrB/MazE/SpoVT family DNA-binding domain-containing protein [Parerythrobacter lacustris]|uniref:AbrB/MazE/SpoVT family DNA-binding domain-containing protein n=1 Tax=Parerythrobacter lacustris TaxID=2969984 RepID=A0ABT1XNP3_9SPHN|nr:AbrB/MazE/SpoVT family DNA-binding domain-containing protein [Parerythrobacter lacustris]MCR2833276.1 AbrB/MazE/SpoVT family DNA-binding domain-containing protein [Parerythrobacter lacustris]